MSSTRTATARTIAARAATARTSVRVTAVGLLTAALVLPAAASTAAPARSTCGAGCTIVSRADIDGDGRADTTSLTRLQKGKAHLLRTVTATGRTASTKVATPWLFGNAPFYGAAAMDGVRGSEIVLRTGSGAHTQFFGVYSWRGGKLVAQRDPAGSTEWVTDGALSFAAGYSLRTVKGTKQLTRISLSRDSWEAPATFSGVRTTAQWKNGRWTPITIRKVTVPETDAMWAGAGWNVRGLPRW